MKDRVGTQFYGLHHVIFWWPLRWKSPLIKFDISTLQETWLQGIHAMSPYWYSNFITFPRKLYTSQKFILGHLHPNVHKRTVEYPELIRMSVSCCHVAFRCLITLAIKNKSKFYQGKLFVSVFRRNEWWRPHAQISGQAVYKIKSKKH